MTPSAYRFIEQIPPLKMPEPFHNVGAHEKKIIRELPMLEEWNHTRKTISLQAEDLVCQVNAVLFPECPASVKIFPKKQRIPFHKICR